MLRAEYTSHRFWRVTVVADHHRGATTMLGLLVLCLGQLNRREAAPDLVRPADADVEPALGAPAAARPAVRQRHGGADLGRRLGARHRRSACSSCSPTAKLRSRTLEVGLVLQCLLVPVTLLLAGPHRLFVVVSAW